jgi:hypothetical protein
LLSATLFWSTKSTQSDGILGEPRLVGVAALLGPAEIAPDLVLEGAAFGKPPLVGGRAYNVGGMTIARLKA